MADYFSQNPLPVFPELGAHWTDASFLADAEGSLIKRILRQQIAALAREYTSSRGTYENFKATFRFAVEDDHAPAQIRLQSFFAARSSLERFYEATYRAGNNLAEALVTPLSRPDLVPADIITSTRKLLDEFRASFGRPDPNLFKKSFAFPPPRQWTTELGVGASQLPFPSPFIPPTGLQ